MWNYKIDIFWNKSAKGVVSVTSVIYELNHVLLPSDLEQARASTSTPSSVILHSVSAR